MSNSIDSKNKNIRPIWITENDKQYAETLERQIKDKIYKSKMEYLSTHSIIDTLSKSKEFFLKRSKKNETNSDR